jgi:hypothetical protein
VHGRAFEDRAETLANLEDNLLLFFTGASRSAGEVLRDQDTRTRENASEMLENLHFTKQLGHESRDALLAGDLRKFAELMHVHWEHKKKRSPGMSSGFIDEMYELARAPRGAWRQADWRRRGGISAALHGRQNSSSLGHAGRWPARSAHAVRLQRDFRLWRILRSSMLPVAILAGGLATRLGPLTRSTSQRLIQSQGEPFIAHQLRLLRKNGIQHVILCVGHMGEMIKRGRWCDGSAFGSEG